MEIERSPVYATQTYQNHYNYYNNTHGTKQNPRLFIKCSILQKNTCIIPFGYFHLHEEVRMSKQTTTRVIDTLVVAIFFNKRVDFKYVQ